MDAGVLLALHLVKFTGPDGQLIEINPDQVVELREPRGRPGEHFHETIKCLIFKSDAKYTAVAEDCETVAAKLQDIAK